MINLNLWVCLSEDEYAKLMHVFGDEGSLKFAMSRAVHALVKKEIRENFINESGFITTTAEEAG